LRHVPARDDDTRERLVVAGNGATVVHLTSVVIRGTKARAGANSAFGRFASAGSTVTAAESGVVEAG
jgi:hypothetical protein